ncbi:Nucleolar protein 12 [Coemansia javaensis]|uniref:Nucleolar protein 12 n=1 Tax=Coemansia javaensis TaxID=2761396 RepID=A0A9W8H4D2_9FUNG|nr:Nucleolar protein 12 [Coemansia javaensis]
MATTLEKGELSRLLVGAAQAAGAPIDSALDSLFANAPPQTPTAQAVPAPAPFALVDKSQQPEPEPEGQKKKKAKKKSGDGKKPEETPQQAAAPAPRRAKRARHEDEMSVDEDSSADEREGARGRGAAGEKRVLLGRMPQDPEVLRRTLFVGNLAVTAITDRAVYKELRELCGRYGRIKTVRFRSIAFSELLPRKIAFISGKLHSERHACNAYVEYAEQESADKAVELNGAVFQDRHLRVDVAANDKARDMKRSVFVGNLSFAAEEEALWRHFGTCGAVENVRIVRDAKTNLGKGFAYVQFAERATVALALKLDGTEVAGRKLRVKRATENALAQKKKERDDAAKPATVAAALESTRSVKGDKPSAKKRRTARSQAYAEKRLNSLGSEPAASRGPPRDELPGRHF